MYYIEPVSDRYVECLRSGRTNSQKKLGRPACKCDIKFAKESY